MGRQMASLAAATALVLTLFGAMAIPGAASVEIMPRPDWSPGDFWTYRVELYDWSQLQARGTMNGQVVGEENLTVGSQVFSTYHVRITTTLGAVGSTAGSNQTSTSDQWLTMDLGEVRSVAVSGSEVDRVTKEWTSIPPVDVPWPLSDGVRWNWTATESLTTTGSIETSESQAITRHYSVQGNYDVFTEAGEFQVLKVTESGAWEAYGIYNETYWSPEAGHWVVETTTNGNGIRTSLRLIAYSYQAGRQPPSPFPAAEAILLLLAITTAIVVLVAIVRRRRRPSQIPPVDMESGTEISSEEVRGPGTLPPRV